MKKIYLLAATLFSAMSFGQVVISQVYGGGGNSGAPYTNDFIELFNRGTVAQSLNGWSVQYTSATGPSTAPNNLWITTPLPNFTLQPGQYFLIKQGGGATGVALPTPDLDATPAGATLGSNGTSATGGIAMSGSNGKVILVSSVTQESTANPTGSQIIDKVGYGTTPTGYEGTGPTGTALTNTTAAARNSNGCTDTNSNSSDFTAIAPNPRNSSTAINLCSLNTKDFGNISGLKMYPNPAKNVLNIASDSFAPKNVEIYTMLGKKVLTSEVVNGTVNITALAKGVYVVKITEEGKTATRELVVE